ncbi:MAG: glycosyltransferase [Acidobacteria bacterium]|nr:MAG: glycosyltransferase [Acidobacteriota bacterium]
MIFSISVPVYGHAEFLPHTLESIRCQPVKVELAVLDATPDDSVQRVLSTYTDMIDYAYHRQDDGQAAAIQEGWDKTSGEIVCWLNADDYYFPDALAAVREVFLNKPDIDVVYGHAVYLSADGNFQTYFPAISENITLLKRGCIICQPSCFVRREAMERISGLNTALHYTMDWDFWLRLYHANCSFYFLNELISAVRVYPDTKTLSGSAERYREIKDILRANVSWKHRKMSLLGFRYYDLVNRTTGSLERLVLYPILSVLARLHRWRAKRKTFRIRGLKPWTNFVEDACEVSLPWYSQDVPRDVTVMTDMPVEFSSTFAGKSIALETCGTRQTIFLGQKIKACVYRAKLQEHAGQVLSFQLRSYKGPWRLLSLEVS